MTIIFAALLIILGVAAYLLTGMRSWTALIPAITGALLLICGIIASNPSGRKAAMHAAVVVALLGFLGSVPGVVNLIRLATSGEQQMTAEERAAAGLEEDQVMLTTGKKIRPVAAQVQAGMAGLLLPYLVLCVKSFVDARRRKDVAGA